MRYKLFLLFFSFLILSTLSVFSSEALLKTTISAIPKNNIHSKRDHIQPGARVQLLATVKNVGSAPNESGTVKVLFSFPEPLDKEENSILFETEERQLPSISPGQEISIAFEKTHQWPTLFGFIRDDWAMREYQAVSEIKGQKQRLGYLTVAFSAYYYEGARMEKPVEVSAR